MTIFRYLFSNNKSEMIFVKWHARQFKNPSLAYKVPSWPQENNDVNWARISKTLSKVFQAGKKFVFFSL